MNEALNDLNDVLNLVISGMPSIQKCIINSAEFPVVLNLVISGMPSIQERLMNKCKKIFKVLNLVISGMPSIPLILLEY